MFPEPWRRCGSGVDTLGRLARPRGNRPGRLVASRGDLSPDGYGEEMVQTMNPKGAANSVVEWGRRFESFLRHRRFTEIEDHGNLESGVWWWANPGVIGGTGRAGRLAAISTRLSGLGIRSQPKVRKHLGTTSQTYAPLIVATGKSFHSFYPIDPCINAYNYRYFSH